MLQEIWEETGNQPKSLANRPTLDPIWLQPYKVYVELSGSRNYSFGGAAEIPFSEFFLYATAHDYTHAEMRCMWEGLHSVDTTFLREQQKRDEERKANKNGT